MGESLYRFDVRKWTAIRFRTVTAFFVAFIIAFLKIKCNTSPSKKIKENLSPLKMDRQIFLRVKRMNR